MGGLSGQCRRQRQRSARMCGCIHGSAARGTHSLPCRDDSKHFTDTITTVAFSAAPAPALQTFAVEIVHDETLVTGQVAYLQAALLYTNSTGERRIRVHTLALPVVSGACVGQVCRCWCRCFGGLTS